MGVIVVAVLVFVGIYGGFSFSPGRPTGGVAATADVPGGFASAGRTAGFAVVVPQGVPASWHGSSFFITDPPGTPQAPPTVRGGWLTPSGAFITLIQSSGDPAVVLAAEFGQTSGSSAGMVRAGGADWTINPGVRQERAWWRVRNGVMLLITGSASPADFAALAGTVGA